MYSPKLESFSPVYLGNQFSTISSFVFICSFTSKNTIVFIPEIPVALRKRTGKHKMIRISYPDINPSVRLSQGKKQVFCIARKRWVGLTPEEWVRQNLILYLVHVKHYPLTLISVERQAGGEIPSRFDIVIYKHDRPYMLVECKEMNVTLSDAAFHQVLRYNISVPVEYIIVTNGKFTFGWRKGKEGVFLLEEIPSFPV